MIFLLPTILVIIVCTMHKTNIMAYNFHRKYNLKYKTFTRDNKNIIQFI